MQRNANEQEKQDESQPKTPSSFASIRAKFNSQNQTNQPASDNSQRNTVQEDLKNLRNRKQTNPAEMSSTASTSEDTLSSTSKKAAEELAKLNLGFNEKKNILKSIFSGSTPTQNVHSEATAKELEQLGNAGSVRAKVETLEAFFKTKSAELLRIVKVNATSKLAEGRLPELEHNLFTERQTAFLTTVNQQMNEDIQIYKMSLKDEMTFDKFLALSFSYRAYQVCLEQDFRRRAACNIKEKAQFNNEELKMLVGIPNELAIQSLNYYKDFFKNLPEIEKIWPGASVEIREAEVKVIFAAAVFTNADALYTILNDKGNEQEKQTYTMSCQMFAAAFTKYNRKQNIADYIKNGNGLDIENHPWTSYGYTRLTQPNESIDFSKIFPVDQVHAQAMNQVNTRVENDSAIRMRKN